MSLGFIRGFLTITAAIFVAGAFVALMGWTIPKENRDAIMILIGALIARSEKIDGFFFGSSEASHRKDAVIAGMASANDPVPPDAAAAARQTADAADRQAEKIEGRAAPAARDPLDLAGAEADQLR